MQETGKQWKERNLTYIREWYLETDRWERECFPSHLRSRPCHPNYVQSLARHWDRMVPDDAVVAADGTMKFPMAKKIKKNE